MMAMARSEKPGLRPNARPAYRRSPRKSRIISHLTSVLLFMRRVQQEQGPYHATLGRKRDDFRENRGQGVAAAGRRFAAARLTARNRKRPALPPAVLVLLLTWAVQ